MTAVVLIGLRNDAAVRIFFSCNIGVFYRNGDAALTLINLNILIAVGRMDRLIHIAALLHSCRSNSPHVVIGIPLLNTVFQLLIGHHTVFIIGLSCVLF